MSFPEFSLRGQAIPISAGLLFCKLLQSCGVVQESCGNLRKSQKSALHKWTRKEKWCFVENVKMRSKNCGQEGKCEVKNTWVLI